MHFGTGSCTLEIQSMTLFIYYYQFSPAGLVSDYSIHEAKRRRCQVHPSVIEAGGHTGLGLVTHPWMVRNQDLVTPWADYQGLVNSVEGVGNWLSSSQFSGRNCTTRRQCAGLPQQKLIHKCGQLWALVTHLWSYSGIWRCVSLYKDDNDHAIIIILPMGWDW